MGDDDMQIDLLLMQAGRARPPRRRTSAFKRRVYRWGVRIRMIAVRIAFWTLRVTWGRVLITRGRKRLRAIAGIEGRNFTMQDQRATRVGYIDVPR